MGWGRPIYLVLIFRMHILKLYVHLSEVKQLAKDDAAIMGKATAFLTFNVSELLCKPRYIVRIAIALSGLIVFLEFYDMYRYMPPPRGLLKALQNAVLGHSGLWLATLRIRGNRRFLVAALMWPSIAVVSLFYWGISLFLSLAIAIAMLWLFVRVVRGEGFENRSVQ